MRQLLIPAMGLSARFAAEGHEGPKALLPIDVLGERLTTVERIMRTVPLGWQALFIVPAEYRAAFSAAIGPAGRCIALAGPTEGQSQTILRGLLACQPDDPVAVQNCDVVFDRLDMRDVLVMDDHVVAHHYSDDPAFSFINSGDRAEVFAEKQPISTRAISGLWRFRTARQLQDAIRLQMERDIRYNGELYLSGALGFLEGGMRPFRIAALLDLGTPEAVRRAGGRIG